MRIQEKLLTINEYSRPGYKLGKVKKIIVHYVGNPGSSAIANRNYFESLKDKHIYASSHFIVGLEGEIIQCVPLDEIAYASNDANSYSWSIECCHPDSTGVFNSKTRQALIELVCYLEELAGLTEEDIWRHFDVKCKTHPTGKKCPLAWASDTGEKYKDYLKFKEEVKAYRLENSKTGEDKELAEAVSTIIKSGISIEFNRWKRLDLIKLEYVEALLEKLGGIYILVHRGIISDKELWQNKKYTKNNIRSLLIKYSNCIK